MILTTHAIDEVYAGLVINPNTDLPSQSLRNYAHVLRADGRIVVWYDAFSERAMILNSGKSEPVTDIWEVRIREWMDHAYSLRPGKDMLHDALSMVAHEDIRHPVRAYLNSLRWDGVERLDSWMHDYLRCPADELSTVYGRRWMVGAVARVMDPGCKMDTVLVLQGAQGLQKSTAIEALASPPWFSDTAINLSSKDAYQQLGGVWLYEWGEIDRLNKVESAEIKSFISARVDKFRPPYGRHVIEQPRQCVLVGTTNSSSFLKDPTGERRYWVRPVGEIDIAGLKKVRDQLWAEAVTYYRGGVQWWLRDDEGAQQAQDAEFWKEEDPWIDAIREYLEQCPAGNGVPRDFVTSAELLRAALKLGEKDQHTANARKVAALMEGIGWERGRRRVNGRYPNGYSRPSQDVS